MCSGIMNPVTAVVLLGMLGSTSALQCYRYSSTNATYVPNISQMEVVTCSGNVPCMKVITTHDRTLEGRTYRKGTYFDCGNTFGQSTCRVNFDHNVDMYNYQYITRDCCTFNKCVTPTGFESAPAKEDGMYIDNEIKVSQGNSSNKYICMSITIWIVAFVTFIK